MSAAGYDLITTDEQLRSYCRWLAEQPTIGFDTEFVSEHTYRPQLCLVQVAAGDALAVIDPLGITDMRPFWEVIANPAHQTIVHAGREEMWFCIDSCGERPARLFDVQLASALVGLEYPAGYGNLLLRLLGVQASKGETRTDWRKRPLSERQLDYALDDVRYLQALHDKIATQLNDQNRMYWFEEEMQAWQDDVVASRDENRWRRVSGSSNLTGRNLAIVREIWRWREELARERDRPPRKLFRDDLIVELAKRRSADERQIKAIRGLDRPDLRDALPKLSEAIAYALELPEVELPRTTSRRDSNSQLTMLGQFLSSALSSICRQQNVATSLVGTAEDVRDLIAYRLFGGKRSEEQMPVLTKGWRAEVVGTLLDNLIQGKVSIRIADPTSDHPLVFEPNK